MRPLILVSTINSRHWNTCYLQLLSVQRCQHPPQAERSCWGGVGHGFRCAGGVPSSVRPLSSPAKSKHRKQTAGCQLCSHPGPWECRVVFFVSLNSFFLLLL